MGPDTIKDQPEEGNDAKVEPATRTITMLQAARLYTQHRVHLPKAMRKGKTSKEIQKLRSQLFVKYLLQNGITIMKEDKAPPTPQAPPTRKQHIPRGMFDRIMEGEIDE